jgi:hypothetical protein
MMAHWDVVELFPELTLEALDSSNKQQYDKPFYNSGGQRPKWLLSRAREREREKDRQREEKEDRQKTRERERGRGRGGERRERNTYKIRISDCV